jgi:hypothetical protein
MRPLSAAQVLDLWDTGQARHPIDRALLALALAMPQEPPNQLADRPIGWREFHLLALRNTMFGNLLDGYAACPACGSMMEFSLDGAALLGALSVPADHAPLRLEDRQWRLPSSRDQAMILDAPDAETAVMRLLGHCCLDGSPSLTPALIRELEARMEALDPAADIRLGMRCTDCAHAWDAALDVGACFWDELGGLARQLLESVHGLASAYGWREGEILALSPARRAAYLSMIG